jgi:hypothetical protein
MHRLESFWEDNISLTTQEILEFFAVINIHYRADKSLLLNHVLDQMIITVSYILLFKVYLIDPRS